MLFLLIFIILIIFLFFWGISRRRFQARKERAQRIEQFRRWAVDHDLLESPLQQWIQRLSASQAQVLLDLLDGYCASLNWELNWLFAPQIEKAPELKQVLEDSVSAYARAILHSLQMEADVAAYQAYIAFEKNPTARKQRTLVQQLYQSINDKQLTPPVKRLFGRFSRKGPKPKEQIKVIQQSFEKHPAETMAALKEILTTDATIAVAHIRQELAPPVLTPVGVAA